MTHFLNIVAKLACNIEVAYVSMIGHHNFFSYVLVDELRIKMVIAESFNKNYNNVCSDNQVCR